MQWHSLEEVVKAFSLAEPSSFVLARGELIRKLTGLHPDKNSGEFLSSDDEQLYHQIMSAIEYVDAQHRGSSKTLPSTIVATIATLPARNDEIRSTEAAVSVKIANKIRQKYKARKMRAAVIAGAIAAVLTFSEKIIAHPLIAKLIAYLEQTAPIILPIIGGMMLIGLLIASGALVKAWREETQAKALAEQLVTDQGIVHLFKSYPLNSGLKESGRLSSNIVCEAVRSQGEHVKVGFWNLVPPIISDRMPTSWRYRCRNTIFAEDNMLAQQAADLILQKLEARGAIARVPEGSFIPIYEISESARKQLDDLVF